MKIVTTTISHWESIPIQVFRRRVTDKLRRDRINDSLETLRLLLLEKPKTHNAWAPRMQKAQILESVVDFLCSDQVMEIISHRKRAGVLSSEGQQGPSRDMMTPEFCGGGGGMIPQGYREGILTQGTGHCEGMTPQGPGYVEAMKSESLDDMVPCLPNVRLCRQPGGPWFLVGAGGGGGGQHPAPHGHGMQQLHGAVTSPSIGGLSGQRQHAWSQTSQRFDFSAYSATSLKAPCALECKTSTSKMGHSESDHTYSKTPLPTAWSSINPMWSGGHIK